MSFPPVARLVNPLPPLVSTDVVDDDVSASFATPWTVYTTDLSGSQYRIIHIWWDGTLSGTFTFWQSNDPRARIQDPLTSEFEITTAAFSLGLIAGAQPAGAPGVLAVTLYYPALFYRVKFAHAGGAGALRIVVG